MRSAKKIILIVMLICVGFAATCWAPVFCYSWFDESPAVKPQAK